MINLFYWAQIQSIKESIVRNKRFNCDEVKEKLCMLKKNEAEAAGFAKYFDRERELASLDEKLTSWDGILEELKTKGFTIALNAKEGLIKKLRGQSEVYKNGGIDYMLKSDLVRLKRERPVNRRTSICLYEKTPFFDEIW